MSRENKFGWLLLPVKSAKKCAGNEKEAKAWSTGLDASCGAEPGAETSMLLHLPSTGANRRLNAPAARDNCDHIIFVQLRLEYVQSAVLFGSTLNVRSLDHMTRHLY